MYLYCATFRYMDTARLSRLLHRFDGHRLRLERERRGLTLAELAKRCEELGKTTTPPTSASAPTINRWEQGRFKPSAPRFALVAKALDVDEKTLCADAQTGP